MDRAPAAILAFGLALGGVACGDGERAADPTAPASSAAPATAGETTPSPSVAADPDPAADEPTAARTVELRFTSGEFSLVGDLHLPAGAGPHPGLILVAGSGAQTRTSTPTAAYVTDRFGQEGFAVLSWDKPGSGESTGELDPEFELSQRAAILTDGIDALAGHEQVDGERIGLWGLSQAGWVMPMVLDRRDVAFMIVVSGGGEDSIEQLGYRIGEELRCDRGISADEAELVSTYGPQAAKATTYEAYLEAMEILMPIEGTDRYLGDEPSSEEDWQPWPPEIDAYLDPMTVVGRTTIPVLAVFGEMDASVDPVQGAEAYERALRAAGNERSHVATIDGAGHTMQQQDTKCSTGHTTSPRYAELIAEWAEMLGADAR